MFRQRDAPRVMAAKYLRLAKDTEDPRERSKFFDYAMAYAQLSEQSERCETSRADDASSTLRVTADILEKSAAAKADKKKREALLDYAKFYREMAELRDQSDAEVDDEPA